MRIIYHHRTQLDDAQGVHVRAMVRAFGELGHEVEVVSFARSPSDGAFPGGKRSWRISTGRLPQGVYEALSLLYNAFGYRRLARALRARRADLIYERYALNTFCGALASRRFGVPLLLEVNAPWRDQTPSLGPVRFRRLARFVERWVCANSARTIAVSEALRQLLLAEGVPEGRVTVMHNAVDADLFDPAVSGQEVRQRYGLTGNLVAGFVGWLRDWHGLADLIDAVHASGLLERGLRLLIVGSGPSLPEVQGCVRRLGLDGKVILTGPVAHEAVPAHIAALDLALQPRATGYACPMKLIEYMAMRRCIVAPDQPNVRELLSDRVSARLFPAEDYRILVEIVAELMAAPAERSSLGRTARRTVVERNLFWRANAARALDLLSSGERDAAGAHSRTTPATATPYGAASSDPEALRSR
jgi:glycosyltransferase involved in cell wall biosynthesis